MPCEKKCKKCECEVEDVDYVNIQHPKIQIGIIKNAISMMNEEVKSYLTENYVNWMIVHRFLTRHTKKGGSTSARMHCKYLGIDPDGYDFKNEVEECSCECPECGHEFLGVPDETLCPECGKDFAEPMQIDEGGW